MTTAHELSSRLNERREDIEADLFIGKARWESLLSKIAQQEVSPLEDYYDEQVWTFLVACGYAACGSEGVAQLGTLLAGSEVPYRDSHRIWFEVLPTPPRVREGNTNVDLAVGDIRLRSGVEGGIELDPSATPSWVCLTEAKWYSDIDTKVTNHKERNQLARVAENSACFQAEGVVVDRPLVTLLTPAQFRDGPFKSRLYAYKYEEYTADASRLATEWRAMDGSMPPRADRGWEYPETADRRASALGFHWVTYDELLGKERLPDSSIRDPLLWAFDEWTP